MAKISQALRQRLLNQKKEMDRKGILIAGKDWTKGKVRLLPAGDEIPGHRYISYYCETLQMPQRKGVDDDGGKKKPRKGTTSPATFGLPCPIQDAFKAMKGADKKEWKRANDYVNTQTEYWTPVVVRGQEGTVENPAIRIFPFKRTVYAAVQKFMLDDVMGEDITHPLEGRDLLVKKTGTGLETEWSCDRLDPSPLHPKKEMRKAILAAAANFDTRAHFYQPDYDILAAIYEGLTGEKMPKHYREAGMKLAAKNKKATTTQHEEDDDVSNDDTQEIEIGAPVTFKVKGEVKKGKVIKIDGESAIVKDSDGEKWKVNIDRLTLVETAKPKKKSKKKSDDEDDDVQSADDGDDDEDHADDSEDDDADDEDDDSDDDDDADDEDDDSDDDDDDADDDDSDDEDDEDADDEDDDADDSDDEDDADDDSEDGDDDEDDADDEDDDSDDDADDEDDEAEEVKPSVSRKGKKKPAKDEKPAKGKKGSPAAKQTTARKPKSAKDEKPAKGKKKR